MTMRQAMIEAGLFTILFGMGCSSSSNPGTTPAAGGSTSTGGSTSASGGSSTDSGTVTTTHIDRSTLTDVQGPIDYSDGNFWICRPGNDKDECLDDLTATEAKKDNTTDVVKRPPATDAPVDCFYVYPTIDLTGPGNMTDFHDVSLILDPLLSQAAPFESICKVYAPLYRQASLGSGTTDGGVAFSGDINVGIQDVEDAFDYYMAHLNHGRNFVLMGHSQGTFAMTKLIQDKVDGDPAILGHMISAVLLGGAVTVPTGKLVGGSFQNIPLCTTPGQVGCAIAYNSFAAEAPPPDNSVFGRAAAGSEIACTAPGPLANNNGALQGSYSPSKINQPIFVPNLPTGGFDSSTLPTPFGLYRGFFSGTCVSKASAHYYEIAIDKSADDQRPTPLYRSTILEGVGFGLHITDYSLSLDDLIAAVSLQVQAMK
ncbi:MAG TPA: DUF3089 domain-containing protein [Polyangiaceae bacterium]|nr:DUF3089 domain-containing protein [Polyangiaceae bacterium]